ncbi:1,3-beta-glucanosyltransferase [Mycena indigotica]|uniref:1,3-beta-glucanosyltransferase n=1 Tax=Mycena indigotica TaxID=2126181 RepID=A0A8H6VTS2_9AGAR|nr:1,3-beta-glucanosyltransferase [Mycena indigotica]KAF7289803.1 1,3-beta-glucanosyltransferase [Mycena indigotica]
MLWLIASVFLFAFTGGFVNAIPKVMRTGKYLYTEDGTRFFIRGIAYQTQGLVIPGPDNPLNQPSTYVDNLADGAACQRDLPFLQQLGVNAIRAYSANASLNHDACMEAFSKAGIYVILDLTLPLNGSIDTNLPMWSTNTLDQFLRTIDAFKKYDNVLAYNVGNEVMTPSGGSQSAPFILSAARDVKAYLNSIQSSALVGYASIDGMPPFVDNNADFLACNHPDGHGAAIDLFGLNNYEWCGDDSKTRFDSMNSRYTDYPVAAYFSEFGSLNCNPPARIWTEVPVMYSTPMTNVWSGGVAFSYFSVMSRGHDFGMAKLSSDNRSVSTNTDFNNLAKQYNAIASTLPKTPAQSSVSQTNLPTCPTGLNATSSGALPPTPDDDACGCLADSLMCRFAPPKADYTVTMGNLVGVACGLMGQMGDPTPCKDISADGIKGVYGKVAMCDPTIRLSYVMSQYYEAAHGVPDACSFAGNATINPNGKAGTQALASKCIPSAAVFTPKPPPVLVPVSQPSQSGSGKGGGSGGGNNNGNGGGSNTNGGVSGLKLGLGVGTLGAGIGSLLLWTLTV